MSGSHRVDLEPAYVLHRRTFRETSALLELFTEHHGRIGAVARGARRPRSALRLALQSFRALLVGWSGRGELRTLRGAEPREHATELTGDALVSGLYLNELLLRLTHRDDPHPALFTAYAEALRALREDDAVEQTLRIFEKRMLECIGYGMALELDADSGEPLVREQRYAYHPHHGPTRVDSSRSDSVEVSGATLLALAGEQPLDEVAKKEAKRLLRFVLNAHLGTRPLVSRTLFRGVGEQCREP